MHVTTTLCYIGVIIVTMQLVGNIIVSGRLTRYKRQNKAFKSTVDGKTIQETLELDYTQLLKPPPQTVKLVATTVMSEGKVVFRQKKNQYRYKYACNDYFNADTEAHLVCKKIGQNCFFPYTTAIVNNQGVGKSEFGRIECSSAATDMNQCLEMDTCASTSFTGVKCRQESEIKCDHGWVSYSNGCFLLDSAKRTYTEGYQYCAAQGGRLASLRNEDQNNFISDFARIERNDLTAFWSSGKRNNVTKMWSWGINSQLSTIQGGRWFPGFRNSEDGTKRPIEDSARNCLALSRVYNYRFRTIDVGYYFWDNLDCSKRLPTLCYKPALRRLDDTVECYNGRGENYRGVVARTKQGSVCMRWDKSPTINKYTFPRSDLKDNFCRNPDGDVAPWCWVDNNWGIFGYCNIQECSKATSAPPIKTTVASQMRPTAGFNRAFCDENKFYCPSNPTWTRCIEKRQLCNQVVDCMDAEDEDVDFCKKYRCSEKSFYCPVDDRCLGDAVICDGTWDCSDGSDEYNCTDQFNEIKGEKCRVPILNYKYWKLTVAECKSKCLSARRQLKFGCRGFNFVEMANNEKQCELVPDTYSEHLTRNSSSSFYRMNVNFAKCINNGLYKCEGEVMCFTPLQKCDNRIDCASKRTDEAKCDSEVIPPSVRLEHGSEARFSGRVEVTMEGVWGTVCSDNINQVTADAVCRFAGFNTGAHIIHKEAPKVFQAPDDNTGFLISNLRCPKYARSISSCTYNSTTTYMCNDENTRCEPQTVSCSKSMNVLGLTCFVNRACTLSEFRCANGNCISLQQVCDGTDNCRDGSDEISCSPKCTLAFNGPSKKSGRLELTCNNIKGFICKESFTFEAAKVACKQLGLSGGDPRVVSGNSGRASSTIVWLADVRCRGDEYNLLECHSTFGQQVCSLADAVSISCDKIIVPTTTQRVPITTPGPTFPCGERKRVRQGRVVGGYPAQVGEFPWQVSIRLFISDYYVHYCGGTIISDRWILSASHCFFEKSKDSYQIKVGDRDYDESVIDDGEQEFFIDVLLNNPKFNKSTYDYDITLIKIKPVDGKYIQFGDNVRPACLPAMNTTYSSQSTCYVSGWGYTNAKWPNVLQAAKVPFLSQQVCNKWYGNLITDRMVCAGFEMGGIDTCQGDSGGPLVCKINYKYTLMGITSWGEGCAGIRKPGVYTRMTEFRKWINHYTFL